MIMSQAKQIASMPTVVDIHKVNGARPAFDLYIGRHVQYTEFTEDSKWCNPFPLKEWDPGSLLMFTEYARILAIGLPGYIVMDLFNTSPAQQQDIDAAARRAFHRWGARAWDLNELAGKRLGCWCVTTGSCEPPLKCHGQIWIKLWREKHHV